MTAFFAALLSIVVASAAGGIINISPGYHTDGGAGSIINVAPVNPKPADGAAGGIIN